MLYWLLSELLKLLCLLLAKLNSFSSLRDAGGVETGETGAERDALNPLWLLPIPWRSSSFNIDSSILIFFSVRYISAISPSSSISCSISSLTLSEKKWIGILKKKLSSARSKQKRSYDHPFTFWTLLVNATSLLFRRRTRSKLRVLIFVVSSSNNG